MPSQRVLRALALVGNNVCEGSVELGQARRILCDQEGFSDEEKLLLEAALSSRSAMVEFCARFVEFDHYRYSMSQETPIAVPKRRRRRPLDPPCTKWDYATAECATPAR